MKTKKITTLVIIILLTLNGLVYGSPSEVISCPDIANFDQKDNDEDDIANLCDNCWEVANPDQLDSNENCTELPYSSDPMCGDACEKKDTNKVMQGLLLLISILKSK